MGERLGRKEDALQEVRQSFLAKGKLRLKVRFGSTLARVAGDALRLFAADLVYGLIARSLSHMPDLLLGLPLNHCMR